MRDAPRRRRITISEAIRKGRVAESPSHRQKGLPGVYDWRLRCAEHLSRCLPDATLDSREVAAPVGARQADSLRLKLIAAAGTAALALLPAGSAASGPTNPRGDGQPEANVAVCSRTQLETA